MPKFFVLFFLSHDMRIPNNQINFLQDSMALKDGKIHIVSTLSNHFPLEEYAMHIISSTYGF